MKQVSSFKKNGAKYWGQGQGQTLTKKTQKKSFLKAHSQVLDNFWQPKVLSK